MSRNMTTKRPGGGHVTRLAVPFAMAGLWLAWASPAWGASNAVAEVREEQMAGGQPCAAGVAGFLGITGLDCRGCVISYTKESESWARAWSFATEPRVTEIEPGSPAASVLRVGDEIVGIDGALITSVEGGRRFASLEPDQRVTLRYRRGGRTADAVVQAGSRCGRGTDGMKTDPLIWSWAQDQMDSWRGFSIRMDDPDQRTVTIQPPEGTRLADLRMPGGELDLRIAPTEGTGGRREVSLGDGRLGFRWTCLGSCSGTRRKDGTRVWRFSEPARVSGIEVGGPADLAGVRIGDVVTAVNGHRIQSREGGEAFSEVRPGQAMRLTLRGSEGRERTVTVVPVTRPPDGGAYFWSATIDG